MPPKGRDDTLEVYISQVRRTTETELSKREKYRVNDNLTAGERKHEETRGYCDIVIKPADEGSGVVVMAKEDYIKEANRQLQNRTHYKPLDTSPLNKMT